VQVAVKLKVWLNAGGTSPVTLLVISNVPVSRVLVIVQTMSSPSAPLTDSVLQFVHEATGGSPVPFFSLHTIDLT